MIFYILYRIGQSVVLILPRRLCYALADLIGSIYWFFSKKDSLAIEKNLKVVLSGEEAETNFGSLSREVFKNFARYLADFFRFSRLDKRYVETHVKVEGEEFLRKAKGWGKGAILLSAHIGNWELGGAVVSLIGYPIHVVALTHTNRDINNFFLRQRSFGGVNVISLGPDLKRCFSVLRENGFIALLGDRDFSGRGATVDFFGRPARMPVGPALFSLRTGACMVPVFLICEKDFTYRFIIEEPIAPPEEASDKEGVKNLMSKYLTVLEKYIKRYPTQWLTFREVWNEKANSGPYTVI